MMKNEKLRTIKADKDCFIDLNSGTRFGRQMASTKDFTDMAGKLGITFMIPPRPMVLEPKPLEWKKIGEGYFEARDGAFTYQVDSSGFWSVNNAAYFPNTATDTESAKTAIHEWRVNHIKSMLP
jgi:hypothetical protein